MRTAKLGEIADIDRSSVTPADIKQGETYVGLEHIRPDGRFVDVAHVDAGELQSSKFRFGPEHILYGKLRPYLSKIARPTFHGVCSTDILPIRPGPDVDRSYLTHVLRSPEMVAQATRLSQGANLPRLSPSALAQFEIPLPTLQEQQRIASILDAADALRAKRRQALEKLDSLAQSIFIDMFGSLEESLPLGELADVQGGLQVSAKRRDLPMVAPYLRVGNVFRGRLDLGEVKTMPLTNGELERTRLVEGDLLVVEGHGNKSEVGRVAIWDGSIEGCVHQNHLIRARCDRRRLLPEFAEAYLNTSLGRRALLRAANTTSGLNTISASAVRSSPVLIPPVADQEVFALRRRQVGNLRQKVTAGLRGAESVFISLQQRAFRGEL